MTSDTGLPGSLDGEGCFYIRPTASGYVCQFAIGLRPDDRGILDEIVRATGVGGVRDIVGAKTQQTRWEVHRKADCLSLVAPFELCEWATVTARRAGHDWSRMAALKEALAERRQVAAQGRFAV